MVSPAQFNLWEKDKQSLYYSSTKWWIKIEDMLTKHRENARARLRTWFSENTVGRNNLSEAAYYLKKMADLARYISKDFLEKFVWWPVPF